VTILYNNLLEDKLLKYPGKYDKYVSYNIFQKFIMMYREDLKKSLENDDAKEETKTTLEETPFDLDDTIEEIDVQINEEDIVHEEELAKIAQANMPKETNWTNLLLGRLK
jgi:hypothetical protein